MSAAVSRRGLLGKAATVPTVATAAASTAPDRADPVVALAAECEVLEKVSMAAQRAVQAMWEQLPADLRRSPQVSLSSQIVEQDEDGQPVRRPMVLRSEAELDQYEALELGLFSASPLREKVQARWVGYRAAFAADRQRIEDGLAAAGYIDLDRRMGAAQEEWGVQVDRLSEIRATSVAGILGQVRALGTVQNIEDDPLFQTIVAGLELLAGGQA